MQQDYVIILKSKIVISTKSKSRSPMSNTSAKGDKPISRLSSGTKLLKN